MKRSRGVRAELAAVVLTAALAAACATAPDVAPPPGPGGEPRPEQPDPREQPRTRNTVRIGVITSSAAPGVLGEYSALILGGARVAAEAASDDRRQIELVLRDDGGTAAGAARAVREFAEQGIRVVVGPLIDDGLAAAADARPTAMTLISPTATRDPSPSNVLALNMVDTRGAAALGRYARRHARVGVLHAATPEGHAQRQAFVDAYGSSGSVRAATYPPSVGNVAPQLRQMQDARVEALYIPGSARELQLLLPQLEYSALRNVQLLGGENWLADGGRGLPERVLEGAIVSLPLLRESDALGWREFVERYESYHRRVLDNAIPALGYDAVMLAVRAAAGGSLEADEYRGASGVLTVSGDSITRRPFLVRREGQRLIPVN